MVRDRLGEPDASRLPAGRFPAQRGSGLRARRDPQRPRQSSLDVVLDSSSTMTRWCAGCPGGAPAAPAVTSGTSSSTRRRSKASATRTTEPADPARGRQGRDRPAPARGLRRADVAVDRSSTRPAPAGRDRRHRSGCDCDRAGDRHPEAVRNLSTDNSCVGEAQSVFELKTSRPSSPSPCGRPVWSWPAPLSAMRAGVCQPGVPRPLDLDGIARDVLAEARRDVELPELRHRPRPRTPESSARRSTTGSCTESRPADEVLADGDLISIDFGAIIDGWHGDAAITVADRRR